MPIPSSGALNVSTVRTEYGISFSNFSNWYSIAANVPASGIIWISYLRGTSASVPSVSSITNVTHNTSTAAQTGNYALSPKVTDTYGAPLTYSISTYTSSYFSVIPTVNSTGAVNYQVAYNKFANTTPILVVITNRFGKTANASIPLYIYGVGPSSSSMGSVSLNKNSASYTVSSYFTDSYSGTSLTYNVSSNPQSSASLSGTSMTVTGNYRATTYTVTVTATNGYNQTASSSLSVTEGTAPSPTATSLGSLSLNANSVTRTLSSYFTDSTGSGLSYSVTTNPYSNTDITNGILTIYGSYRATTYTITVTATNGYSKTASSSLSVTESTAPSPTATSLGSMSLTTSTDSRTLSSYFTDSTGTGLSYSVTSDPKSNTSISGGILYVYPNYRNTSYTVTVTATNGYNKSRSSSLSVTESAAPAPTISSIPSFRVTDNSTNIWLGNYVSDSTGTGVTYSVSVSPSNSNIYLSGSFVFMSGSFSDPYTSVTQSSTYTVTVTATNGYSRSASRTFYVYQTYRPAPAGYATAIISTQWNDSSSIYYSVNANYQWLGYYYAKWICEANTNIQNYGLVYYDTTYYSYYDTPVTFYLNANDSASLILNTVTLGTDIDWQNSSTLTATLITGTNIIRVACTNNDPGGYGGFLLSMHRSSDNAALLYGGDGRTWKMFI